MLERKAPDLGIPDMPSQASVNSLINRLGVHHPIYLVYYRDGEITGGSSLDERGYIKAKANENRQVFLGDKAIVLIKDPQDDAFTCEPLDDYLHRTGLRIALK